MKELLNTSMTVLLCGFWVLLVLLSACVLLSAYYDLNPEEPDPKAENIMFSSPNWVLPLKETRILVSGDSNTNRFIIKPISTGDSRLFIVTQDSEGTLSSIITKSSFAKYWYDTKMSKKEFEDFLYEHQHVTVFY